MGRKVGDKMAYDILTKQQQRVLIILEEGGHIEQGSIWGTRRLCPYDAYEKQKTFPIDFEDYFKLVERNLIEWKESFHGEQRFVINSKGRCFLKNLRKDRG